MPAALFPEQEETARSLQGPVLTLALAQRIALAVANDSGTGHIFAASGSPLISLFGHTSVEKFVEEPSQRTIIRAADIGGVGMDDIPVSLVTEALEKKLMKRET